MPCLDNLHTVLYLTQVRGHFRPEFVNRIDEFIIFEPLQLQEIKSIVKLQASLSVCLLGDRCLVLFAES